MKIEHNNNNLAFAYLRLSREEMNDGGESSSITNQRMLIQNYCNQHGITLVREFVDDGYTGSNFNRPNFQKMLKELQNGLINIVITKDLSRLGREFSESSYYAEVYFPEHQIRYIAIADNFDSDNNNNTMAPFLFAMNEVYLRDGSRKVREVLKAKRKDGQYCACPPYGYKKDPQNKNRLILDENTSPIVKRIFEAAAQGDSSRKIAQDLNNDGIIPPLKYRVLYRDDFGEEGAARASDLWNYTTIKRMLKNEVYLGHTLLGKTSKKSFKSKTKTPIPKEDWSITRNTHDPIVSEETFNRARENLGKGSNDYRQYDHVRKSIFSGIVKCALCGHSLCSAGSVYKGERNKYWYLSCINKRTDIANPCDGTRIKYSDLVELITDDLNSLISLSDEEIKKIVKRVMENEISEKAVKARKAMREKIENRLKIIDKMIPKLYTDNAEGKLDDERLTDMVSNLQKESTELKQDLIELNEETFQTTQSDNYKKFFDLIKQYSHIDNLEREDVITFIDKIEIGPKILPEGKQRATHKNSPYEQSVRIYYKFIGEMENIEAKN